MSASTAISYMASSRRTVLLRLFGVAALLAQPDSAPAAALAELQDAQYMYRIAYPQEWKAAPKPVKTHMHETLLASPGGRGVKVGVTVDPVKIASLEEFGTLPQVTERVLAVERKRDGVQSVTLRASEVEAADTGRALPSYYTIEYLTESSRGRKVFCCKYCITDRKLYVLQAQANAEAYDGDEAVREALLAVVQSFRIGV